jgi:hypothetical protein
VDRVYYHDIAAVVGWPGSAGWLRRKRFLVHLYDIQQTFFICLQFSRSLLRLNINEEATGRALLLA